MKRYLFRISCAKEDTAKIKKMVKNTPFFIMLFCLNYSIFIGNSQNQAKSPVDVSNFADSMSIDKQGTIGYTSRQQGGYMKFVSVKDFKLSPTSVWKKLSTEREMVVTTNGKPIALLTPVSDEMLEDMITAVRRAKALIAMKRMQDISTTLGNNKMTLENINAVIKEVRGKNKK